MAKSYFVQPGKNGDTWTLFCDLEELPFFKKAALSTFPAMRELPVTDAYMAFRLSVGKSSFVIGYKSDHGGKVFAKSCFSSDALIAAVGKVRSAPAIDLEIPVYVPDPKAPSVNVTHSRDLAEVQEKMDALHFGVYKKGLGPNVAGCWVGWPSGKKTVVTLYDSGTLTISTGVSLESLKGG